MGLTDNELERRARGGDVEALLALGGRFAEKGDVNRMRACFAQAAKLNSTAGLRELAKSLLVHAPISGDDGVAMMRNAAEQGDGEAAHLCGILAAQDENLAERWRVATEASRDAASRDHRLAQDEQALLQRAALSLEAFAKPAQMRLVFETPRIGIIENFAPPEICDWLIARAKTSLSRAQIYDELEDVGRESEGRTNSAALFSIVTSDLIIMAARARIKASVARPDAGLEPLSILHYAPGERFEPHYDFLDPVRPAQARDLARKGQRIATCLLYLNEDFDGGETEFPRLDFRYKGKKGDALVFWNVTSAGTPDRQTFHAGLTPTRGEKWLLSQWIREAKR